MAVATIRLTNDVPHGQIDRLKDVLATEFRRGDTVGMRSDHDIVVALEGVSRRVATNRMTSIMARLDLDAASTSVGIALFPTDGRSAAELAGAADRASDLAARHGGPAVVNTTWRPVSEQALDALVVDADPVLARVLVAGLGDHGLRAELIEDGREALDQLVDRDSSSVPRVLLLDLDAPGMDGLAMLRQLRGSGVLSQLKVLLMTARSSESDLRVALDLGVADVIRKPFSATLLMHRVSQLLEDG